MARTGGAGTLGMAGLGACICVHMLCQELPQPVGAESGGVKSELTVPQEVQ